jgi:hypothetical protein
MQEIEIRVKGHIDEDWSGWLGGLSIRHSDQGLSILSGDVPDQAALYGLIKKLRDLGLALVSVRLGESSRLPEEAEREGKGGAKG